MSTTEPAVEADLEALEQEREFLLRSLADLDAEYEAGDIGDDDYRCLTDDYTARAAGVLRAIEAARSLRKRGKGPSGEAPSSISSSAVASSHRRPAAWSATVHRAERPQRSAPRSAMSRRRSHWRAAAVVIVVLGFGAVAAWAVTQSSGTRLAGETATGNNQLAPTTTVGGGVDPRLLTASKDVNAGDVADALKLYDAVLKDDPTQPVALAYGGWLEANAGLAANRSDLVDAGLVQIVKSEQADPTFADPHFFRGYLLLHAKNDAPDAVTELRYYLGVVDPSAPQIPEVEGELQQAIKLAGPNVPPGPLAATTTTPPTTPASSTTSRP